MHILHVSDGYLPRVGGIEKHVHDLAHRQVADGHDVAVMTSVPGPFAGNAAVTVLRPAAPPGSVPTGMRHTAALTLNGSGAFRAADVVHVHASAVSPLAFAAIGATSRAGVPTVVTMHSMLGAAVPFRLGAAAFRWRPEAVEWTAVSDAAARPLSRALGPAQRVNVLGNAVDVAAWAVRDRAQDRHGLTVASVGRLVRRKRPAALVQMLRSVRNAVPRSVPMRALLVGDGPLRTSVQSLIDKYGMRDWVILVGDADRATIRRIYRAADLYVAPAILESFGIAALEARSAGLPVMGRAGCGIAEFIAHGVDGMFARDDTQMVEHIVRYATDKEFSAALRRNCASSPSAFDWADVLPRTYAAYLRAAARVRRSAVGAMAGR
jgi:glycosyltransferase involved in cell wall biosynthesis